MATRGGKREGAGRKSKADELTLIESMDAILVPEKFWAAVALNAVEGDGASQKLWASYRFGMPKQAVELTGANGGPVVITGMKIT